MEGPSESGRDIYLDEADTRKALQIPTQGSEMSGVTALDSVGLSPHEHLHIHPSAAAPQLCPLRREVTC